MLNLKLLRLVLVSLLAAGAGCSQKSSSSGPKQAPPGEVPSEMSGGTSDPGGGGEISFSTDEEVIAAIKRARAFLVSDKGHVFIATHLKKMIPDGESASSQKLRAAVEKLAEENLEAKLARSTVEYKTDDTKEKNCAPKSYGTYPDAYTKEFKLGAGVCFNVHRLRRLTPESIYRSLISLWMHEIAHLNGYGESVAVAVGDLSSATIVGLQAVSARDTFDAIFGMLRTNLKTVASLKAGRFALTESLRAMRSQFNAIRGFRNFLLNLDILFALDDERPNVRAKVIVFLMEAESVQKIVELYCRESPRIDPVRLPQISRDLEHASLCAMKSFMAVASDLKYGSQMRTDSWKAEALGIGDWRKEKCD